jgi:hypothetical protein
MDRGPVETQWSVRLGVTLPTWLTRTKRRVLRAEPRSRRH